jgi:hypothetical protein
VQKARKGAWTTKKKKCPKKYKIANLISRPKRRKEGTKERRKEGGREGGTKEGKREKGKKERNIFFDAFEQLDLP